MAFQATSAGYSKIFQARCSVSAMSRALLKPSPVQLRAVLLLSQQLEAITRLSGFPKLEMLSQLQSAERIGVDAEYITPLHICLRQRCEQFFQLARL
jgi:hypothetical protein